MLDKINAWSVKVQEFCLKNLKLNKDLDCCNFRKIHHKLAVKFKKIAKKTFWIKSRKKRSSKPPIWPYLLRKLRKAEKLNDERKLNSIRKLVAKYFPDIDENLSLVDLRKAINLELKRLLQERTANQIKYAVCHKSNVIN